MGLFILFVLAIALLVTLPIWPYSKKWGYKPSGLIALLLVIIFLLILLRVLSLWDVHVFSDSDTRIIIERQNIQNRN